MLFEGVPCGNVVTKVTKDLPLKAILPTSDIFYDGPQRTVEGFSEYFYSFFNDSSAVSFDDRSGYSPNGPVVNASRISEDDIASAISKLITSFLVRGCRNVFLKPLYLKLKLSLDL